MWTYNDDTLKGTFKQLRLNAYFVAVLPTRKYKSVSGVEPRGFLYFAFLNTCIYLKECSSRCHSSICIVIISWSVVLP